MSVGEVLQHLAVDEYHEAHKVDPSGYPLQVFQLRQIVHATRRISNAYRIAEVLQSVSVAVRQEDTLTTNCSLGFAIENRDNVGGE